MTQLDDSPETMTPHGPVTWTGRLRVRATKNFPPDPPLPAKHTTYAASWNSTFGGATPEAGLWGLAGGRGLFDRRSARV